MKDKKIDLTIAHREAIRKEVIKICEDMGFTNKALEFDGFTNTGGYWSSTSGNMERPEYKQSYLYFVLGKHKRDGQEVHIVDVRMAIYCWAAPFTKSSKSVPSDLSVFNFSVDLLEEDKVNCGSIERGDILYDKNE